MNNIVMTARASSMSLEQLNVSKRIIGTDAPIITKTKSIMKGRDDVLSLAQGIVYWSPPKAALEKASLLVDEKSASLHQYGPTRGLPELCEVLTEKLRRENGLTGVCVMITAGANQAYTNVVLALTDESDRCVLFAPYYFNHLMAHQMTGGAGRISFGPCHSDTLHPDLDWLEAELSGPDPPRLVTIVNPCNPTGVLLSREEIERAVSACARAGAWLVLDNTYEHFVYDGREHFCARGPNVINIFSFSKAYGMMGWRVGYIAFPEDGPVGEQLDKVQDTIPICPTQISMQMALGAVSAGRDWVAERVQMLEANRAAMLDALSPLGTLGNGIAGGEGAIYLWGKLPSGCEDDQRVMKWLVDKHRVCIIPGSSCGCPGYIRAAYANLEPHVCKEAAQRLKAGLQDLVGNGMH